MRETNAQDSYLIKAEGRQSGWEGRLGNPCETVFACLKCLFRMCEITVMGGGSLEGPTLHDTTGPPVWLEVTCYVLLPVWM